jgi:ribosomal-protein-alanine N-acetyltransferase
MNMSNLQYKKATIKDIPLLVEMDKQCFNRSFDNQFTENEFRQYVFDRSGEAGFIYSGTDRVGYYAWVNTNSEESEIVALAILPEHQKRGFGSVTMTMLLDALKHAKRITVMTHPHNIGALKTYMNNGFVISGFREDYYGPGQPRVMLQRDNTTT